MPVHKHRCVTQRVGANHPLAGKKVYIPDMAEGSVEALCAVLRWMGIEARPTPPSDARSLELGGKHTSGDECFPAKITTGDFLKIAQQPGFDAKRTVFFMGTTDGPCRFGQYAPCGRSCANRATVTYRSFLRTENTATATSRISTLLSYGRHAGAGLG